MAFEIIKLTYLLTLHDIENLFSSAHSHGAYNLQILCIIFANSAQILCPFQADFSTLKLSVALPYDPVCHTSILAWFYLVHSFVLCALLRFYFNFSVVLFYYVYIEMVCTGCGNR